MTGFVAYNGDGFAVLLPSKWNPSREQEFPGTALRYRLARAANGLNSGRQGRAKSSVLCTTEDTVYPCGRRDTQIQADGLLAFRQRLLANTARGGGSALAAILHLCFWFPVLCFWFPVGRITEGGKLR